MLFFRKRNPLMRQRFKNSNNISVQDIINTINTFNDKLDQLNSTMSEVRDLLAGGVSYTTSNNDTGTKRSSNKNQEFYIPEPDISSIKSSNKERKKKTIDSKGVSDALNSLNDIDNQ